MTRVHSATTADGFAEFERGSDGTAVLRVNLEQPGLAAAGPDAPAALCAAEIDRTRVALRRLSLLLASRFLSLGVAPHNNDEVDHTESRTWATAGDVLLVKPVTFRAEERFAGLRPLATGTALRSTFDRLTARRIDAIRAVYGGIETERVMRHPPTTDIDVRSATGSSSRLPHDAKTLAALVAARTITPE